MKTIYTPLRYPGGKAKLAPFFKQVFEENYLCDAHYAEPFAGGAGVALSLLMSEHARHIHLNDISYPVYSLWHTVLNNPDYLCRKITTATLSPRTWQKHKRIIGNVESYSKEEVGFAFLFLNRTNRSGIINGGMIGGKAQEGEWKIDARFNRKELIRRIDKIALLKHRISIYNLDAAQFIKETIISLPTKTMIYFDPPYYTQGRRLYPNFYNHDDHVLISKLIQSQVRQPWIVTYDNDANIAQMYKGRKQVKYNLNYSANKYMTASEIMIFSDSMKIPSVHLN